MPKRKKEELPIPKASRLFCGRPCLQLRPHSFSGHDKISVEKAWTPEGVRLFQADRKLAQINEGVSNYRRAGLK